ncbi:hypothetical protein M422DRAFT_242193 [Sphaerobolus stellatus SS14]|nr:hypothetical protein M422DRAFT_242193 [Sphaerobolus stellatus SS14]
MTSLCDTCKPSVFPSVPLRAVNLPELSNVLDIVAPFSCTDFYLPDVLLAVPWAAFGGFPTDAKRNLEQGRILLQWPLLRFIKVVDIQALCVLGYVPNELSNDQGCSFDPAHGYLIETLYRYICQLVLFRSMVSIDEHPGRVEHANGCSTGWLKVDRLMLANVLYDLRTADSHSDSLRLS